MRIAVLFDGAGLARKGLEDAGHECVGVELDRVAHHLGTFVGDGEVVHGDATEFDLSGFDGLWASPPCQTRSLMNATKGAERPDVSGDYLEWCLGLVDDFEVSWIENVVSESNNKWGTPYNAAQFTETPIQSRARIIGGRHPKPRLYRPYKWTFARNDGVCPTILATEYKHSGCKGSSSASRFYNRRITPGEAAHRQGFTVPKEWWDIPEWFDGTPTAWRNAIYRAIGNGVPVYMAKAFGDAAI